MNIYMAVAGLALMVKLWLIFSGRDEAKTGGRWLTFIIVLAILNLSEILIYFSYANGYRMDNMLRAYYVFCVMCPCFGFQYIMADRKYQVQKYIFLALLFSGVCLGFALAFSDVFISGYEAGTYPVRAVKSEWFGLVLAYCLISVFLGALTALYNYFKSEREDQRVAYFCALLGISTLALTSLVISAMMALGLGGNGSMFLPIATSVFAAITWYGRSVDLVIRDARKFNPLSPEAKFYKRMDELTTSMSVECIDLKDAVSTFERTYLEYRLEKTRDRETNKVNKSKAARILNIERSTFYKKISKT